MLTTMSEHGVVHCEAAVDAAVFGPAVSRLRNLQPTVWGGNLPVTVMRALEVAAIAAVIAGDIAWCNIAALCEEVEHG